MRKYLSAAAIALCALILTGSAYAQDKDKAKEKEEKTKNKLGEYDEIIIRRKNADKDGKVTIEIKDGEVKVNGKAIDEYDDENLTVRRRRPATYGLTAPSSPFRSWNYNGNDFFNTNEDRAFLGVVTEDGDGGARITGVTNNSAAEKAGLKKGDIITKINEDKVDDHSDITRVIAKAKPEEKVTITYKRDGKENKVTATLGKRTSSTSIYSPGQLGDFDFNFDDGRLGQVFAYGGRPRIGIQAQDTEDGKGVKVLNVEEGSAAEKAGIKKDDIITEFEGKDVNSADALAAASRDSKDKVSVKIKVNRGSGSQTFDVKIPRKLKTANL